MKKGKPRVRGPAYTAGARATKQDSFLPSSGHIPFERDKNASPFPCEWPTNAIYSRRHSDTSARQKMIKGKSIPFRGLWFDTHDQREQESRTWQVHGWSNLG